MSHLTPDEIVDAVEDALAMDRRAHLSGCATCQASVDELTRLLERTREVAVPEPSPLFWQHFSQRISAAIDAEAPLVRPVGEWLRWQVLAPMTALALIVATLTVSIPREADRMETPGSTVGERQAPDATADSMDDSSWGVVADLVGPVSLEDAERAGLVPVPGAADRALTQLTAAERAELSRLLTLAIEHPES